MAGKFDVYQMVTDKIVEMLEGGIIPWQKPWQSRESVAWSGCNGKRYSLLNQFLLMDFKKGEKKTLEELFASVCGEWLTFKEVQKRGGKIKKGEHAKAVVFFKMLPVKTEEVDENGNPKFKNIPILKYSNVFHTRQCEGIEQKFHKEGEKLDFIPDQTAQDVADSYLNREHIQYVQTGNQAFYSPKNDKIVTPKAEDFVSAEEYYSTLFHEITHSTGAEKRLNRIKHEQFGDEQYSLEELVAEIGSASLCATTGIDTEKTLKNSAAYIQNWLKALKNDRTMIVKASNRAERAVRFVLDIKEEGVQNNEED